MKLVGSLGEEVLQADESIRSGEVYHLSFPLYPPQASQAAQEAEINARKAKNSVSSLLNLINNLLEQLGE